MPMKSDYKAAASVMTAEEYFDQNRHRTGLAYSAPLVKAWPVREGEEIVEFVGRSVLAVAPEKGWQVFYDSIGRFVSDNEFNDIYEYEGAPHMAVVAEKEGLKRLSHESFVRRDISESGQKTAQEDYYRVRTGPDDAFLLLPFFRITDNFRLAFGGEEYDVPVGSVLYEVPGEDDVALASAEEFFRDFKVMQQDHSRPQLRVHKNLALS